MATITIQEAQASLPDLIHRFAPGEEVLITEDDRLVTHLITIPPESPKKPRELGTMRGTVLSKEHFDDPLEEFKEYR